MKLLTATEWGKTLTPQISGIRVRALCLAKRVKGAIEPVNRRQGWRIPSNAKDPRKANGRPKNK